MGRPSHQSHPGAQCRRGVTVDLDLDHLAEVGLSHLSTVKILLFTQLSKKAEIALSCAPGDLGDVVCQAHASVSRAFCRLCHMAAHEHRPRPRCPRSASCYKRKALGGHRAHPGFGGWQSLRPQEGETWSQVSPSSACPWSRLASGLTGTGPAASLLLIISFEPRAHLILRFLLER